MYLTLLLAACTATEPTFDNQQVPPTDDILALGVDDASRSGLTISATADALVDQVWDLDVKHSLLSRAAETVTLQFGAAADGYDVSRTCNGTWDYCGQPCRDGAFVVFPVAFTETSASGDFEAVGEVLIAAYEQDNSAAMLIHHDLAPAVTNCVDLPSNPEPSTVTMSDAALGELAAIDSGSWDGVFMTDVSPGGGVFQLLAYTDGGAEAGVLYGDFTPPGLFE